MVKKVGKGNIEVEIIQDSISIHGNRFVTIQSQYPRFIHSQCQKHRAHSSNTSSSRAVPIKRWIEIIKETPAIPVKFGSKQAGMVAGDEFNRKDAESVWLEAMNDMIVRAQELEEKGYHKEVVNRLLEPFMMIREVRSGTEWNNFFHLRVSLDAQSEIAEWARLVYECMQESEPMQLDHGEWHVPYVYRERNTFGELKYYDESGFSLSLKEAKAISSSCCAQVSYRRLNKTYEKALDIYGKLIPENGNLHATPFEHPATPMSDYDWGKRLVAAEMIGDDICLFKGNVRGWIQHRKEFKNENNTKEFKLNA